jgi:hypothetical protein
MTDDEVPPTIASVVGHVCGVVAVGMASVTVWAIWMLVHRFNWQLLVFDSICLGLTVLLFRWAGALTGYWDTRGRLAVPKVVYAGLGVVIAAAGIGTLYVMAAKSPMYIEQVSILLISVVSCGFVAYFCYLTYKRFK